MRRLTSMCLTAAAAVAALACSSGPPPPVPAAATEATVIAARQAKDAFFKNDPNSPIPADQRSTFTRLEYFPVDRTYQVPASLQQERVDPPVEMVLATSKNVPRRVVKVGTLHFTVAGSKLTLSAFAGEEGLARLFVPFGDLTNRQETYGGGRYMDLDRTATGLYDLDFNQAYNPYCVYNINYECPVPPPENRLPVAIRAGEVMPGTSGTPGAPGTSLAGQPMR